MLTHIRKRSRKTGLPPGTVVYTGDKKDAAVHIDVLRYGPDTFEMREGVSAADLRPPVKGDSTVTWVSVTGVHDAHMLETIGGIYGLHPLVLEDIANTGQRTKVERFDEYVFIVMKLLGAHSGGHHPHPEQLCIIVGDGFVITFSETLPVLFSPIRKRLSNIKEQLRHKDSGYLAYAVMDAVVDGHFIVLDGFAERLETLDKEVLSSPNQKTLRSIYTLKGELHLIRKTIAPLREIFVSLERGDTPVFDVSGRFYLRDIYDHVIQLTEITDSYREAATEMTEIYLSNVNMRTNTVIQELTVVATIFLPLTFLTGVYGMNFKNMPELEHPYGYFISLAAMGVLAVGLFLYFRRKRIFLSK
ncbi:MAG: magnesium/cobalt transporter CorA [Deltaproteobacteria bacterium]|nr:magnesium/cobalt transporter CorA [Deltaproteobacteria bacterium]